MRPSIPPEIVSGATALLKPYFPDLDNERLVRALFSTEQPRNEVAEASGKILTVRQACKMLQVSKPTFYGMVHAGKIKTCNLTGSRIVRVAEAEILRLMQS